MSEYCLLAYGVACLKWKMFADDLIASGIYGKVGLGIMPTWLT
jgi:hypothetical protein